MRRLSAALLGFALLTESAFAFSYSSDAKTLPYQDVQAGTQLAVAAGVLLDAGAIQSKHFLFPNRLLNRAEFVKIAFVGAPKGGDGAQLPLSCYKDIPAASWFAPYACREKVLGMLQKLADGTFHPLGRVTYGEAVSLLNHLYGFDLVPGENQWSAAFITSAKSFGPLLGYALSKDHLLTRGEMTILASLYLANERGELNAFEGAWQQGSSSSISSSSSSAVSSSSSSASSASSQAAGTFDPLPDTAIRSQLALLGQTSPIIAAANILVEEEPVEVKTVTINTTTDLSATVQAFLIYDENRRFVGHAALDATAGTGKKFKAYIPSGTVIIPKRETHTFYIRAVTNAKDQGGVSQATIQVNNFFFEVNGVWSNLTYSRASTDTFLAFQTARSKITTVANAEDVRGFLINGTNRKLGAFRFSGRTTDANAQLKITDLTFDIGQTGGVQLSNVQLGTDSDTTRANCTVSGTSVVCSSIPASFGDLQGGSRMLTLYGDIVIPSGIQRASLRLTLNQTGDISTPGAVTWTDGSNSFTWVDVASPVASGEYWTMGY